MSRHCHPRPTRPTPTHAPQDRAVDFDVLIAGASFAGLAVARALPGRHVAILDPNPVGAVETSAGAVPLPALEALDAAHAARETHPHLILHTPRGERSLPLDPPYAIADYPTLCRHLAGQADAPILKRRATAYRNGTMRTDRGPITTRAAVDATGQRATLASTLSPGYAPRRAMGAAIEIVLHRPRGFPSGLHIYLTPDLPPGYGWAFGAADTLRVGAGVLHADRHGRHLDHALQAVLHQAGLERAGPELARHGGLIPLRPRHPVVAELFVVGDAAGQALPATAEGIRPALHFGTRLGGLLADALDGLTTLADARTAYRREVASHAPAYRELARTQTALTLLPPAAAARLVHAIATTRFTTASLRRYQRALAPHPAAPRDLILAPARDPA